MRQYYSHTVNCNEVYFVRDLEAWKLQLSRCMLQEIYLSVVKDKNDIVKQYENMHTNMWEHIDISVITELRIKDYCKNK